MYHSINFATTYKTLNATSNYALQNAKQVPLDFNLSRRYNSNLMFLHQLILLQTPCVIEIYYESKTNKDHALHILYKIIHYNHKCVPSNDK